MSYPDEGEIFKADKKKHAALIFFVHFYQGNKKALRRHIQFVNSLGYDAYAFNLKDKAKDHYGLPYSMISKKFGLKHALADQIEEHLDLLTHYPQKIIFSFSNVSGCVIETLARRKPFDILGMITDSGPSFNFFKSAYNLYAHANKIRFLPFRLAATPILAFGWSPDLHKYIHDDLRKLPEGFKILSIRGWKDLLIKPVDIDLVFEPCKNLHWEKLSLPEAAHLTGLRDFPDEYKPGVEDFLKTLH